MTVPTGSIYQSAFVVPDLQAGMREWAEKLGVGPWMVFDPFGFTDQDGTALPVNISIALAFSGDHFIELIQVNDDTPSVFSEVAAQGGGFHHMAKLTTDPDADIADMEAKGFPLAFRGYFGDSSCSFIDTRALTGVYLEFVHVNEGFHGLLGFAKEAHKNWDGQDLILELPTG